MRKIFKLILAVLFVVAFLVPTNISAKTEKVSGILYNSYTGEKIEDVSIDKLKLSKDHLSFELNGTKKIKINANFVKKGEIDGNVVDFYYGKEGNYEVKIAVLGDIVSGKFVSAQLAPAKRVKVNYDDFSFIISRNEAIDLNETLKEVQLNDKVKSTVEQNKAELNNIKQSLSVATTSAYSGYVYANSSSTVAEGTAY